MVESPAQLDYAPQPKWHRRKRARRAVLLLLLLLGAAASVKWIVPAWGHVRMLYWQEKCLSFEGGDEVLLPEKLQNGVAAWEKFYTLFSPPGRKAGCTVFLHEVRRKDGVRRLVAIEASESNYSLLKRSDYNAMFDVTIIRPGSLWHRPEFIANPAFQFLIFNDSRSPLAIRYGTVDPKDASHFAITLPQPTGARIVDGWLGNDDKIVLELRDALRSN